MVKGGSLFYMVFDITNPRWISYKSMIPNLIVLHNKTIFKKKVVQNITLSWVAKAENFFSSRQILLLQGVFTLWINWTAWVDFFSPVLRGLSYLMEESYL